MLRILADYPSRRDIAESTSPGNVRPNPSAIIIAVNATIARIRNENQTCFCSAPDADDLFVRFENIRSDAGSQFLYFPLFRPIEYGGLPRDSAAGQNGGPSL